MKAGEIIYVSSNAELLNTLGLSRKEYKRWMRTTFNVEQDTFVWMITLDGKNNSGWINEFHGDTITEKYVGGKPYPDNIDLGLAYKTRLVFEKIKIQNKVVKYIFRGIYRLNNTSTRENRILNKISDETNIF